MSGEGGEGCGVGWGGGKVGYMDGPSALAYFEVVDKCRWG